MTEQSLLKITEFGVFQWLKPVPFETKMISTAFYTAPEVFEGKFDNKCDIWSCGAILYLMLCGEPPFTGNNKDEILKGMKNTDIKFAGSRWEKISEEAKDLIRKMLVLDPTQRLTAQEAWEISWVQDRANGVLNDNLISSRVVKKLVEFKVKNKLQQATMEFIYSYLLPFQDLAELKKQFELLNI